MFKDFSAYKRLLTYLKPYWKVVMITMVGLLAIASLEPVLPYLLRILVDESLIAKDPLAIKMIPIYIIVVFITRGIAEYSSEVGSKWIAAKVIQDLQVEIFGKFNSISLDKHMSYSSGKLMSKITFDVNNVGNAISESWIILLKNALIIIALMAMLFYTSWELTLIMLFIAPIVAWIIEKASSKMFISSEMMQNKMGSLTAQLKDALQGYREIKINSAEQYEKQKFWEISREFRRYLMKVVRVSALNVPLVQILASISLAVVIYYASLLGAEDKFTPGEFIAFITAMLLIFEPIRQITKVNVNIQQGTAAALSVFGILDLEDEKDTGKLNFASLQKAIKFQQVSFGYRKGDNPVVDNLTLSIKANQTTAFVGKSGSGKTTIVNLISRFYNPQRGKILFDSTDLADIKLSTLRKRISLVSQNVILFNDTIAANIAYGNNKISKDKIIQAAKDSGAMEFITKLQHGFDTEIGENGFSLSGGQRQRLAIARAFLKNAPILILDEATSALDNESELLVKKSLKKLCRNRTVIIIAHRLSTVETADNILVFDKGYLIEQGKHAELLKLNGIYAKLHQLSINQNLLSD